MDLPLFDGNILEWTAFWDQFSSNIDNRNVAEVDKLLYLKGTLKGQAKQDIEGLESTNANYKIAVKTLMERYGKPTKVIDAHYSALTKIVPARNCDEYRRVLNDIERHLRILNSLGEDMNHSYFRFLILGKFPEELVYEIKLKVKDESIEEIRKELDKVVSAKEDANRATQKETGVHREYTTETLHVIRNSGDRVLTNNNKTQNKNDSTTRRNLPTKRHYGETSSHSEKGRYNQETKSKRPRLVCVFCHESHYSDLCQKYKTLDERRARVKQHCFQCLKSGHFARNCNQRKRNCYFCKGGHHGALCPKKFSAKERTTVDQEDKKLNIRTENVLHVGGNGVTFLQTAVTEAKGDKESTKARLLLDSGSQRTYITKRLAKKLNLKFKEQNKLTIFTFGSKRPQEILSPIVQLRLMTKKGSCMNIEANIISTITKGVPAPNIRLLNKPEVNLADDGSQKDDVDILIENDYYFSIILTERIKLKENLYLVDSHFGWIVSGINPTEKDQVLTVVTYFQTNLEINQTPPDLPLMDNGIKELWSLESVGINDSPHESKEEEAVRIFNDTTRIINNRYHVQWPWIEYPPPLTTNFGLAYGRLLNLFKRLDKETKEAYNHVLKEQQEREIIEVIPSIKEHKPDHAIHYLPHHGIKPENKSMRIVYDASSKTKDSKSLNECLYKGPLMLEDLTGLIIKFRQHPIGISADVEKAFLQIGLQKRDRDVTRFLWVKDIEKLVSEENLIHLRFCRVPFGIISSPFILNATIRYHLNKSDKTEIKDLARDIYVDNAITGTNTIEEAINLYKHTKTTFQEISMNMRDWSSNAKELLDHIPDRCQNETVGILGLNWNTREDTLELKFTLKETQVKSKRELLRIIASVFDPCGFTAPLLLGSKLLLQELWSEKIGWDAPLSKELSLKWDKIQKDFREIQENRGRVPRYYFTTTYDGELHLHCFTDASTKAYAAVVYLSNGNELSFVMGKSRLVPIKKENNITIPRLELLAVLIGSRLLKFVLKFISKNIKTQTLWTDSQIVIDWHRSNKVLPPFIARRIEEIKKNKELMIRHIPTEMNPADVATRPELKNQERKVWLEGPTFLLRDKSTWPSNNKVHNYLAGEGHSHEDTEIVKPEKIRQVEIKEIKYRDDVKNGKITNNNMELRKLQADHFSQEINGEETNLKRNLRLFKDVDGILRCKGRLENTNWSFDKKYPILIPRDCEFTNNLITKIHEDNYHVGVNHTLSLVRETYWIPQGKRQVQKVLKKCPSCIKQSGGPFKLPPTPALPAERVNYSAPFTYVGVDYMGPLLVKSDNRMQKRWICLFTCLVVRAVHLEIVNDLTAEEGLLSIRRMIATRGIPTLITSDNAQHFKLMAETLENQYCITKRINWRFIPQRAPWFGGYYERLVGIVKNCLKRTLQKHLLKDNQLSTIVKEVEAVINTRPLTCIDSELEHVLRPADFLAVGKCLIVEATDQNMPVQGTVTKENLILGWKRATIILQEYKDMFYNRYLMSLRERYQHSPKEPRVTSKLLPKEGQIVQIKGETKNRESWQVGKIIELIKSADNEYRVAKIKVGNKEFIRSIAHLYPLEIEENEQIERELASKKPSIEVSECEPLTEVPSEDIDLDLMMEPVDSHIAEINESSAVIETTNDDTTQEEVMINAKKEVEEGSRDENMEIELEETETRPQRIAAKRALEKIKQWTKDLLTVL